MLSRTNFCFSWPCTHLGCSPKYIDKLDVSVPDSIGRVDFFVHVMVQNLIWLVGFTRVSLLSEKLGCSPYRYQSESVIEIGLDGAALMVNWLIGLRDWVDARLPIMRAWNTHMGSYYAPKKFNFVVFLRCLIIIALVNQLLTGIWLTMNYVPSERKLFPQLNT